MDVFPRSRRPLQVKCHLMNGCVLQTCLEYEQDKAGELPASLTAAITAGVLEK